MEDDIVDERAFVNLNLHDSFGGITRKVFLDLVYVFLKLVLIASEFINLLLVFLLMSG